MMGLDTVEFVFALEDAFGIAISDPDAAQLLTPRNLVDYLEERLRGGDTAACLEQRAFYRLRQAGMKVLDRPRAAFTPETRWADLLHDGLHQRQWQLLQRSVSASYWPPLKPFLSFGPPRQTVAATARTLVTRAPSDFMKEGEGWSRPAIESAVTRLMHDELGISSFKWTDRFVKDLGVE